MGVPGILWVAGHMLELFARLVEHLGVLEHTPALIVVKCGLRLFHASILPSVTRVPETNSSRWGSEQEQHPAVDPRWTYKSSSYSFSRGLTGGKRGQVGRKGTRYGRQHVSCEMALYKPC